MNLYEGRTCILSNQVVVKWMITSWSFLLWLVPARLRQLRGLQLLSRSTHMLGTGWNKFMCKQYFMIHLKGFDILSLFFLKDKYFYKCKLNHKKSKKHSMQCLKEKYRKALLIFVSIWFMNVFVYAQSNKWKTPLDIYVVSNVTQICKTKNFSFSDGWTDLAKIKIMFTTNNNNDILDKIRRTNLELLYLLS